VSPSAGSANRSAHDRSAADRLAGGQGAGTAERVPGTLGLQPAALLRLLVDSSPDAIIVKDAGARIISWNAAAERLYGYSAEEAVGQPLSLIVPSELDGEERALLDCVLHGRLVQGHETERITRDGRRVCVSLTVSPLRDEDGTILGVVAVARDLTTHKRLQDRLHYVAQHDAITGLFNRRRFEEELDSRLARASRYGQPGAVMALDLDHFKLINDTFGHTAGDALLGRLGRAVREGVRAADVVGRTGGDEFAVVMSDIAPVDAFRAAEKLLGQLRGSSSEQNVTVSIGVAPFGSRSPVSAQELMIAADIALYEAKIGGRNRVAIYRGPHAGGLNWIKRIREAVPEGRLALHCQPIVELESGRTSYEELLVRLCDERGRLLAPASFLPTAERFGMVSEIDGWVLDRALELSGQGREIAVNLSALSVGNRELMGRLERRLIAGEGNPRRLVLEITETAALTDLTEVVETAHALAKLGCRFALDDFGTGFVNFDHLKHLPLTYLKIDALFVRNLTADVGDRHVVEAIVSLARAFGQTTIAEGVESEAVLRALPGLGVQCAQGFHLGRPAPLLPGRTDPAEGPACQGMCSGGEDAWLSTS
jgi:diguanylate cyclase (GGDEF)-like protein/PAS domain S-box-containing protein